MSSLLQELTDKDRWDAFLCDRIASGHLSGREISELSAFVAEERYRPIAEGLAAGRYTFSIPRLSRISKGGSGEKRIIYRFEEDEVWILKHLAFLLHSYDHLFSDACYSFRRDRTVRDAVKTILSQPGLHELYCLKADIHDYFNSIPSDRLCRRLSAFLSDDPELVAFLRSLLTKDLARDEKTGELLHGNRGAMAGTPTSPFLANLYLLDMDRLFTDAGITYLRYADDILLFAGNESEAIEYRDLLCKTVQKEGLILNEKKSRLIPPGATLEFLGFKYENGIIDISDHTAQKIKAKIRRKAHSIYRWRLKKQATFEQAAFVLLRSMNGKFYDVRETGDFSWSKWFFPIINTSASLKEIDAYLLQYVRYLDKGRHYKGNYRISYDRIRELGFRSLVHEYYGG
ncbi:MAG: hypothetical protein K6G83_02740 [Lachnospiraceae bacterium]|nr:hypothetical protein [Lachnospiraceae bacterium]